MGNSRTIVVGDVHGCLDEFRALLDLVSFVHGQDRLVQVGDLMDRGPDPVGCVRFARELGAEVLMGNHEEKHVRFRKHEANRLATGKKNPMKRFSPEKAAQNAALSDEEVAWMAALPMTLDLGNRLMAVHAGLEPAFSFQDQSKAVLRVRYVDAKGKMVGFTEGSLDQPSNTVYWTAQWNGPESVVYGHAVHSLTDPRVDLVPGNGKCFGIDTGCVFGGRLTAMVLVPGSEPEFAQVQAQREYFPKNRDGHDA
jgi:bis(5'-nucleosyl)-tetraphosphatase (symmetrical)